MNRIWLGRLVLILILVSLFTLLTFGELASDRSAQKGLENRFDSRLSTASNFLHAYVSAELKQEQSLSEDRLSSAVVTQAQFDAFAQDFQFGPSLLLNSRGQVLDVIPPKPSLIGADLAPDYSHLRIALAGRRNVSQVVSSAVQHIPVVAFAVPFSTSQGRRVMSGTLQISSGPLGAYLLSVRSIPGSTVSLVDDHNRLIDSASSRASLEPLSASLDALPVNTQRTIHGQYEVSVSIVGTPWKIVATLPLSELFAPLDGSARIIPWAILLAFAVLAAALGVVLLRSWEKKLLRAEEAGVDPLTLLANRRQFDERAAVLYSAARRHQFDLAVLMIDIDHFKSVNDNYGHQGGDHVLKFVADCVRSCLRSEDIGARWGGEEFVVILPYTGLAGARNVAERLRQVVEVTPIVLGDSQPLHVTVSVGVAAEVEGVDPSELLSFADLALYEAKGRGRNCVVPFVLPTSPATL